MKYIYLFCLIFITIFQLNAQESQRAVVELDARELNAVELLLEEGSAFYRSSDLLDIPLKDAEPFIAYSIVWYADRWEEGDQLLAVFSGGAQVAEPTGILPDVHALQEPGKYISQLYFTAADQRQFRLYHAGRSGIKRVEVHFFSPGETAAINPVPAQISDRSACPCPFPELVERDEWCPGGSCPPDPTPVPTDVTHLIIHHSAGSNTSSDWAAVVRSIWDFHVNVNGWDDIGYNYLIDPNGILYEGRGNDRLGAHFCGTNGGTMGVCVMGDFTNVTPTQDARDMLHELFSWKACDKNIDPLGHGFHSSSGEDLMYVSGHRDGCATACPGNSFYPLLPDVRIAIQERIDNVCNGIVINAPTNLTAEAVSSNEVQVTWEDNADNEDGYVLERSISFNNNFTVLSTLPANTVGYDDFDVLPSTGYFYRVKAIQGSFSSLYSNEDFTATNVSAAGNNNLNKQTVLIAPNPAADIVSIEINHPETGPVSYGLFDATGKQVINDQIIEKDNESLRFSMPIAQLPAGVYWIRLSQQEETALFRLMKQ